MTALWGRLLRGTVASAAVVALLASCAFLPPGFFETDHQKLDARMEQIAAAIEARDPEALRGLFSAHALDHAPEFDTGLEYFFSFFPGGDLTWERDSGAGSRGRHSYGESTELLTASFTISTGSSDYTLWLADFTEADTIGADHLGLHALGIVPWTDDEDPERDMEIRYWIGSIGLDDDGEYGYPGIFVPRDDVVYPPEHAEARVAQIAAALRAQDAAALEGLFSPRTREQTPDLVSGIAELAALFPTDDITWESQGVNYHSGDDQPGGRVLSVTAYYKFSAGGDDYWLFLADRPSNTLDPEDVGLVGLGVERWTEPGEGDPDRAFSTWNSQWSFGSLGDRPIFVPRAK